MAAGPIIIGHLRAGNTLLDNERLDFHVTNAILRPKRNQRAIALVAPSALLLLTSHNFERLEENIENIRVVRYPAGILKLDIVDGSGRRLDDGRIFAMYELEENPSDEMKMSAQIGWNQEDGLFRLSSIVPGIPVSVHCSANGFQAQTKTIKMEEGERRTVTIELIKEKGDAPAAPE